MRFYGVHSALDGLLVVGNGTKFHASDQSVIQTHAYSLHAFYVPSVAECENRLVVLS